MNALMLYNLVHLNKQKILEQILGRKFSANAKVSNAFIRDRKIGSCRLELYANDLVTSPFDAVL